MRGVQMKREAYERFNQQELMAGNMYGEARFVETSLVGEVQEWLAIGSVVMNRYRSNRWPQSIKGVILQKAQFSWLTDTDPSNKPTWLFLANQSPPETYKTLMRYANTVITGRCEDFSGGANHYVAEWFYRKAPIGHWCLEQKIVRAWGGHIFLTDGRP